MKGSICEAYLVEETSTFVSYYYPLDIPCMKTRVSHNDDESKGEDNSSNSPVSIFNNPGRLYENTSNVN